MWTIYEHPADYPDRYVARLWVVTAGQRRDSGSFLASPDLELIRHFLQNQLHLTVIPRSPDDDPVILESWF